MTNDEVKLLWADNDGVWLQMRHALKARGLKLSQQDVYDIINNIQAQDRVAPCGKQMIFTRWDRGYQFCGSNCACAKDAYIVTRKETNLNRYGVENPMQVSAIKERFVETMTERYGSAHALQVPEFVAKARESNAKHNQDVIHQKRSDTMIERYGADNPLKVSVIKERMQATMVEHHGGKTSMQSPHLREKIANTNIARYGYSSPLISPEIRKDCQDTLFERYGVTSPFASEKIQNDIKKTNLERYGSEYATQNEEVKDRTRSTNIQIYDRNSPQQQHISLETLAIIQDRVAIKEYLETRSLHSASEELGIDRTTLTKYWYQHGLPALAGSSYEAEISEFLTQHNVEHIRNTRKIISPLELDFYIPSHNLAIEFNGIYWHSSQVVDNDYHRRKYELCRDLGIRLLMINEDEWIERGTAWRDRILNIVGKSPRGLAARKLTIREIDQPEMNHFCDQNHIQGATRAVFYSLGAFDNDRLVGVMAFNLQRGTREIELIRFCTDGTSRAGLFSRMFKRSIADNEFTKVLSFADLRHSLGDVYHKNGFSLHSEIRPDYRYIDRGVTYHKSAFTKARIAKKFPELDMNILTERQAMQLLDIPRIYDCGKLKFVWNK